jgi:hypothetical protein
MSNPDPNIELKAIRLRISLLEEAFRETDKKDESRCFLLWFELGSAYASYNMIIVKIKEAKLEEIPA